jgi:hypothetical protein
MTAVAYIRQFGGTHSFQCNEITLQIWEWAEERNNWLSSTHIAGVENTEADRLSRGRITDGQTRANVTEWGLNSEVFHQIWEFFAKPDVDLFASALNAKCAKLFHGQQKLMHGKLTLSHFLG